ncbi:MAG: hypothetical protein ACYCWB_00540 [Thiobacillus sp.]
MERIACNRPVEKEEQRETGKHQGSMGSFWGKLTEGWRHSLASIPSYGTAR